MTTKEQERQAIEKIRKIVEGLGENSYVGFAMEGVLELAEDNIREDTAYSMKKWDGCVYLCEKPQDAAKFVAIRGHDEVAVIEVILPANKVKESFDHSVQFFQCKAFMYEEDIKVRPNAEVVEYSFK